MYEHRRQWKIWSTVAGLFRNGKASWGPKLQELRYSSSFVQSVSNLPAALHERTSRRRLLISNTRTAYGNIEVNKLSRRVHPNQRHVRVRLLSVCSFMHALGLSFGARVLVRGTFYSTRLVFSSLSSTLTLSHPHSDLAAASLHCL